MSLILVFSLLFCLAVPTVILVGVLILLMLVWGFVWLRFARGGVPCCGGCCAIVVCQWLRVCRGVVGCLVCQGDVIFLGVDLVVGVGVLAISFFGNFATGPLV